MADTGNGKPLLGGCGGEERTGSAKQDPFQFSLVEFAPQFPTQGNGAAPATGASCVETYDALSGLKSFEELEAKINAGWAKNE